MVIILPYISYDEIGTACACLNQEYRHCHKGRQERIKILNDSRNAGQ
jgi:hypothetical protein